MKKQLRFLTAALSLLLALTMLASVWVTPALAAPPAEKLSDEQSRKTSEITLADGTKTGVLWSDISVSGSVYGADRQVNMVEVDLSNTHLSMEVLTGGQYMVSAKTLNKAAADYNAAHEGQTVLAAVNGDLWMTAVHSGSSVSKKVLKVTRGILMIDGEIWASQQIDQENLGATNAEKGTPAGNKAAFGVTSKNQPLVGSPDIRVTMTVNGKEVKADGINRLPALNALIVYNHRVNDTNYALNDAYEVELKVDDTSAFKAGGEISAKVVAIYKSGAATRPSIGEKTILLTARGNRVSDLQNNFKVGDTVTFKTTLTDRMGRTDLWQDVQDAIGGHMQPIVDGKLAVANGDTTAYPAAFVGYRDDGSVVLCSVTSTIDGSRAGLRFKDGYKFCTEMGFNSVFYLDGGGSCTFITLEEGSYTIRNKCSDGNTRSVINGIGAAMSATTCLIIAISRFTAGAWMVLVAIPVIVLVMEYIHRHYHGVQNDLGMDFGDERLSDVYVPKVKIVMPISNLNRAFLKSLHYAMSIQGDLPIERYHVASSEEDQERYRERVEELKELMNLNAVLVIEETPYRNYSEMLLRHVDMCLEQLDPHETLTVVMSQIIIRHWWQRILHNQTSEQLKRQLEHKRNVSVVSVPFLLK